MTTHPSILLIDDSPGEQELFRLALTQAGLGVTLYTEQATDAALHWLEHRVPYSSNHSLSAAEGSVAATHVERGPSATAHSASTVAIDRNVLASLLRSCAPRAEKTNSRPPTLGLVRSWQG